MATPTANNNYLEGPQHHLKSRDGNSKCLWGLNYSPYNDDGSCPAIDKVASDLKTISEVTSRIRLYATDCNQLRFAAEAITKNKLQMEIYAGIWISDGDDRFKKELDEFVQVAKSNKDIIKGVSVGNEELYKNSMDEGKLIGYINTVRQRLQQENLKSIPVYTTETSIKYTRKLADNSDVVQANIYSIFNSGSYTSIQDSVKAVFQEYDRLRDLLKTDKVIRIGESGWSSNCAGSGLTAPCSVQLEQEYFKEFVCNANSKKIEYFYFEVKDAIWKGNAPPVEENFGIYDANYNPKFSFQVGCSC
ncbi:hypothetical protein EV182_003797 [Spiromyces aspiralis]|uniref:Uncharacterized protein n=1 Tax=Spiromyces aspiralis TaxID=68401 RepID=A0ACC1HCX0_9FUNG|nr:hypothetical protein EV182_003797 [Spiromyces aspiralis]